MPDLTPSKFIETDGAPYVEAGADETQQRQNMKSSSVGPDDVVDLLSGQIRPTITSLTGGTASDLDGIATVGVAVGLVQSTLISSSLGMWALEAGTDAEGPAPWGPIRPDDYAASTNEKIWKKVL